MKKSSVHNFEPGSYSERCNDFFTSDHGWEPDNNDSAAKQRTVTWTRWPYRFWLLQYGIESKDMLRRKRIEHKLFNVALLSAARSVDGLRDLERWFIISLRNRTEKITYFSNIVSDPEVEKVTGEMVKNDDFVLRNKLYVPNAEDMIKLDYILKLGSQDGYNRL